MKWQVTVTREVKTKKEAEQLCEQAQDRGWKAKKKAIASKKLDTKALLNAVNELPDEPYSVDPRVRDIYRQCVQMIADGVKRRQARVDVIRSHFQYHGNGMSHRPWDNPSHLAAAMRKSRELLIKHGVKCGRLQQESVKKDSYDSVPDGHRKSGYSISTDIWFVVTL